MLTKLTQNDEDVRTRPSERAYLLAEKMHQFERRSSSRQCTLTFDQLLARFAKPSLSITSIAREAGVTKNAMCKTYNMYFREFFGETCRERGTNHTKRKKLRSPFNQILAPVAKHARRANGVVGKFLTRKGQNVSLSPQRTLLINALRCYAHSLERSSLYRSKASPRCATSLSRSVLEQVDFAIFHIRVPDEQEKFFVIPAGVLYKKLFTGRSRATATFYIPLDRASKVEGLDIWAYEDAWHLIKASKT